MKRALPEIELEKCIACGDCVVQCPSGAVGLINGKPVIVRPEDCNYCTNCEDLCPFGAIKCYFEIVLPRDKPQKSREEKSRRRHT